VAFSFQAAVRGSAVGSADTPVPDVTQRPAPGKRPAGRKSEIVDAATKAFHERGYASVSVADIAHSVGVSPAALYRHYSGKNSILQACIDRELAKVEGVLAAAGDVSVTEMLRRVSEIPGGLSALGTLWRRESRNLPEDQRKALRVRLATTAGWMAGYFGKFRPELSEDESRLLAWGVPAVFVGTARLPRSLEPAEASWLQWQMGVAVAHTKLGSLPPFEAPLAAPPRRSSRRESLLQAAVTLFEKKGFQPVSAEDIAAANSVSPALVHYYFGTKTELLRLACHRVADGLQLRLAEALSEPGKAADTLSHVVRGHIDISCRHRPFANVLSRSWHDLPGADKNDLSALRKEYLDEWCEVVRRAGTTRTPDEVAFVVFTAIAVIDNLMASLQLTTRPGFPAKLHAIAMAVLSTASTVPTDR
jgi:AcrR family transcriptional regulator